MKGIDIVLYEKTKTGVDAFNRPIYTETETIVKNVLVAPTSAVDVVNNTNLSTDKATYTLAIPKGDTHEWENCKVKFFGAVWRSIGLPQEGIEELIPLSWNKKVVVERYE